MATNPQQSIQTSNTTSCMDKYKRLKKLGWSIRSIVDRMQHDNVDITQIEKFAGKTALRTIATNPSTQHHPILPRTCTCKPTTTMKPFHWAKVNPNETTNTVWKDVVNEVPHMITQLNLNHLDALFYKQLNQPKHVHKSQKQLIQILDPKRAHNVKIERCQSTFSDQSDEQLIEAIIKMDDTKLSVVELRKLLPCLPNKSEQQIVRDYVKNGGNINQLSEVEQFFVKMMDIVDIRQRISLWILKIECTSFLENIKHKLDTLNQAIEDMMSSKRLKKILYIILIYGNYINTDTSRGNACGFLMEPTLALLRNTKSVCRKSNLMLHIVKTINNSDADTLKWVDDLDILDEVHKVKLSSISEDINSIKRDMNSVMIFIKNNKLSTMRTTSDWSKHCVLVSLNQLAVYIRKLSKSGPQALFNGCETYDGLKSGMEIPMSGFGRVRPHFGTEPDDEEPEDVFPKEMLLFYKRQNRKVIEVETLFRKVEQGSMKVNVYFGFEENKKIEEVLDVFCLFRVQFMQAMREMKFKKEKEYRKQMQDKRKAELAAKLSGRPSQNEKKSDDNVTSNVKGGKAYAMWVAMKKTKKGHSLNQKVLDV